MTEVRDGNWTLFAFDQETGRSIWSTWEDGKIGFRIDTPADAVIEANTIVRNADHGARFGEFVRIASVPMNLYHQAGLAEATAQKDDRFLSKWLNDSDNAAWRTREGTF